MLTSNKLIIAVGIVGLIIIGLFSFFSARQYRKELISQIENSAHQLSETVKNSTRYDMLLNQRESVHQIINTIGAQSGIEQVRIFNKAGMIIFSSDKKEINHLVDKKTEACYACHTADKPLEKISIPERTRIYKSLRGHRNLGIINPIYNEKACWYSDCHVHNASNKVLGVLDITMSLEKVDSQIQSYQINFITFAFVAVIANSFILWLIISRLLGKPLREFLDATKEVAQGNFKYKVEIKKEHEFGKLAQSFNAMTQKLSDTQRQLYHNAKLASLGQLAAGVAHEINNPLTGVLTYSSYQLRMIDKGNIDKIDLHESLEVVVRETKRCREIVQSLLDFSRQAHPKKSDADINKIIDSVLTVVDNQLSINHISVDRKMQKDLPHIKVDKNQIEQVFINLVVNAFQAIGSEGGTITITTGLAEEQAEKFIEIKISDTGCGIPKENFRNIFEPFFSTKDQKGTGLGLSVVWGIIDEHRGSIKVESEIGKGSTFTILIPVDTLNNTA